MEDIILIGFGGHAKSVADCIERQKEYRIIGYTELAEVQSKYPYLGTDDVLKEYYKKGVQNVAICQGYLGKGNIRERIYKLVKEIGFCLPVIADPSSVVAETAIIGEGTFIGKGAIVNAEASVGKMCIINTKALIEHECVVGDFSHVAVGATICGQVEIGKRAFIGSNATVIQCMNVTDNRIIPAGITLRENNKMVKYFDLNEKLGG